MTQLRRSMARSVYSERMVVRRALGKGGEIGRLRDRQLVHRLVEVGQRRAGDAVGAEAEEDLVDVELEDAVLGIGLLDAEGEDHLLDLALVGLVLVSRKFFATCCVMVDAPTGGGPNRFWKIVDDRAEEAGHVDAGMFVEILVLGRQERRLDAVRHGLDRQVEPPLARELAHQRTVRSVHAGRHRRLVFGQHFVVGQILGEIADKDGHAGRRKERERRADAEEIADQTYHARSTGGSGETLVQ